MKIKRDWDELDAQAENEGLSIKGANKIARPMTKRLRALDNMGQRGDTVNMRRKIKRIERGKQ